VCKNVKRHWCLIQKSQDANTLEAWAGGLEKIGARPPRLNWAERQHLARDSGASVPGCSDDECQLNDVNVTGSIAVTGL
jgi:hypothetical protein